MNNKLAATSYLKNKFSTNKQTNQYKDLKLKQISESYRQEKQLNEYLLVNITRHDSNN
jgi:hypothetical protein